MTIPDRSHQEWSSCWASLKITGCPIPCNNMSSFVGVFNRSGEHLLPSVVEEMLAARPERAPDGHDVWTSGAAGIGLGQFNVLPEACDCCLRWKAGKAVLAADVRLDNREELGRQLGIAAGELEVLCDACVLLLCYERWGESCLSHLQGDFAFVLWDAYRSRLFAGRDPLGERGICYSVNERYCLIASEISNIIAHPEVIPRINEKAIATYLTSAKSDPTETLYQDIYYLPAACALSVGIDDIRLWEYWTFNPRPEIRYKHDQEYADHYLSLLNEAIRCRIRSKSPIGISLSGGLDSSAIAALAAPLLASYSDNSTNLTSFSYAFDDLTECDERAYIRPLVQRYGIQPHYLLCDDKWTLKEIDDWPTSRDYILADPFALLPAAVRIAAERAGINTLLVGYYGDSLFGGGAYWALDMFRHGRSIELVKLAAKHARTIRWRETFFDYGVRRLIPSSLRNSYRQFIPRRQEEITPGIDKQLIRRTKTSDYQPQPKGGTPWHPGLWERYNSLAPSSFVQGYSAVRFQYNRHRLEAVQPYYDRRLVEFVLAVPAYILGGPDYDRRLHRLAMRGILPEEIRLRRGRTTFFSLALRGLRDNEWPTVLRLLSQPQVIDRGYVEESWLRERLNAGFDLSSDSVLLWRILCLELWLQRYWS